MTVTVDLDDDVYELISVYAGAREITLGAAIGELIRQPRGPQRLSEMVIADNGLPLFRSTGRTLTPEMVKAAQDDEI